MSSFTDSAATGQNLSSVENKLRESLRRCSEATFQAALAYRSTKSPEHILPIIQGIIERFVDPDKRALVRSDSGESLKLVDDLGLDSLTIMEIVMLVEEVMETSISNDELRSLATIGDVRSFIDRKTRGENFASIPVAASSTVGADSSSTA